MKEFRSKLSQKKEETKTKEQIVYVKTGYRVGIFEISIAVIVAILMIGIGIVYALIY